MKTQQQNPQNPVFYACIFCV